MTFSEETLTRARALGSATLHEAAGRIGALPSGIKPVALDMVACGRAYTVHCPPVSNLQIHHALYHARPGDVLVVHVSGAAEAGYWGDILNEAAIAQGLGGLVIDGGVRDTARLSVMGFPVFSNGVCIRGTGKDYGAAAWLEAPVRMGEVVIRTGDLVLGDRDGVVVIPADQVERAVEAGEAREADETRKIEQIRKGVRTIDLYGFSQDAPGRVDPAAPFYGRKRD